MLFKAHAPGSLMLLGEYAVLHGKPALVCAVDKRIHVSLAPRNDNQIFIHSDTHGDYQTNLQTLKIEKPFQFVLAALLQYQGKMRRGCDLTITTDFSDKIGFGSSSAVTVATLSALATWQKVKVSAHDLIRQGRMVVRSVQGVGSGADIAAAVCGGMVAYQAQPLSVERIPLIHPITAIYAGFKTPTTDAIASVQARFQHRPDVFKHLCHAIGQCAQEGINEARKQDWQRLGEVMNIQQGLMDSLGVSMPVLRNMIDDLRAQPQTMGAKISGSGLGDCVIALGDLPAQYNYSTNGAAKRIPVQMTLQGVHCDEC